jgi:hypothetical protein
MGCRRESLPTGKEGKQLTTKAATYASTEIPVAPAETPAKSERQVYTSEVVITYEQSNTLVPEGL